MCIRDSLSGPPDVTVSNPDGSTEEPGLFDSSGSTYIYRYRVTLTGPYRVSVEGVDPYGNIDSGEGLFHGDVTPPRVEVEVRNRLSFSEEMEDWVVVTEVRAAFTEELREPPRITVRYSGVGGTGQLGGLMVAGEEPNAYVFEYESEIPKVGMSESQLITIVGYDLANNSVTTDVEGRPNIENRIEMEDLKAGTIYDLNCLYGNLSYSPYEDQDYPSTIIFLTCTPTNPLGSGPGAPIGRFINITAIPSPYITARSPTVPLVVNEAKVLYSDSLLPHPSEEFENSLRIYFFNPERGIWWVSEDPVVDPLMNAVYGRLPRDFGSPLNILGVFGWDYESPSSPILISPEEDAVVTEYPIFLWHPVTRDVMGEYEPISRYVIQFSRSGDFSDAEEFEVYDAYFEPDAPMEEGEWYWRVIAYDLAGCSSTSITRRMIVVSEETLALQDFSLQVTPAMAWVEKGVGAEFKVTVTPDPDYDLPVSLSYILQPQEPSLDIEIHPTSGVPPFNSTLTVETSWDTPCGNYTITVIGRGPEGRLHLAPILLTVEPVHAPVLRVLDFSITDLSGGPRPSSRARSSSSTPPSGTRAGWRPQTSSSSSPSQTPTSPYQRGWAPSGRPSTYRQGRCEAWSSSGPYHPTPLRAGGRRRSSSSPTGS